MTRISVRRQDFNRKGRTTIDLLVVVGLAVVVLLVVAACFWMAGRAQRNVEVTKRTSSTDKQDIAPTQDIQKPPVAKAQPRATDQDVPEKPPPADEIIDGDSEARQAGGALMEDWKAKMQAAAAQPSSGVYALQRSIDFDCLDGAVINPENGRLSLFGHKANSDYVLAIPYLDYLGTALECESPSFSLEWTEESYPVVDHVLRTGGEAILDTMAKLCDDRYGLTAEAAWYLQEHGVPISQGANRSRTLFWMLKAAGHPRKAEVVRRLAAWLDAEGASSDQRLALYEALGVDGTYWELQEKYSAGKLSKEQFLDEFFPKFFRSLGRALDESQGDRYADRYQQSRDRGRSPEDAFGDAQDPVLSDLTTLVGKTLAELAPDTVETHLPLSLVRRLTGGKVPIVRPKFNDLPPRSMLARLAFQADVAGKLIPASPQLKHAVSTYRTESAFCRAKGRSLDECHVRVWLAPGEFELTQSKDGRTVRISKSEMTINIRRVDVGAGYARKDVADPLLEEYARELTRQYDELAEALPVLHVLREAMKVVALTRWVRERGLRIRLPQQGRQEWSPPETYPGILHFSLCVERGKFIVCSSAEGGVDLSVDPDLRDAVAAQPSDNRVGVPTEGDDLADMEQSLRDQLAASRAVGNKALGESLKRRLASILLEKALELWRKGDQEGFEDAFDEAVSLDPNAPEVYEAGTELLGGGGDWAEGVLGVTEGERPEWGAFDWRIRRLLVGTDDEEARSDAEEIFFKGVAVEAPELDGKRLLPFKPLIDPRVPPEAATQIIRIIENHPQLTDQLRTYRQDYLDAQERINDARAENDTEKVKEIIQEHDQQTEEFKKEVKKVIEEEEPELAEYFYVDEIDVSKE